MSIYQLTINERQALLMAQALDAWSRIRAGQLSALEDVIDVGDPDRLNAFRYAIEQLRIAAGLPDHIDFRRPGCKEAFNVRKVLEHGVSWDNAPPEPGAFQTTNYDGPMAGWWEGPPAVMLKLVGDEAVRIRDDVNRRTRLGAELAELLGTDDIEGATKLVRYWKENVCRH